MTDDLAADFRRHFVQRIDSVEGSASEAQLLALYSAARLAEGGAIVELGAGGGRTTVALALGSRDGQRPAVLCVDPHQSMTVSDLQPADARDRMALYRNIVSAEVGDVATLVGLPWAFAARAIDGPLSLLVISSNSAASMMAQVRAWSPKLHLKGTLALLAAGDDGGGLVATVERLLAEGWRRLTEVDALVALKPPPATTDIGRWKVAPAVPGGIVTRSPSELVVASRLDLGAKHLYARLAKHWPQAQWGRRVYLGHLQVWNAFFERVPPKRSAKDFVDSFDHILAETERSGPEGLDSCVPLSLEGSPLNGAHRITAALLHGRPLRTLQLEVSVDHARYDGAYFERMVAAHAGPVEPRLVLSMALEFIRLAPQCRVVTLFEHTRPHQRAVEALIAEHGATVWSYERRFEGADTLALIRLLYERERWLGDASDGFSGAASKATPCFAAGAQVRFVLMHPSPGADLSVMKSAIRALCGVQNHSVHINDTVSETDRILRTTADPDAFALYARTFRRTMPDFSSQFEDFREAVMAQGRSDDVVVVGSAVLAAYGLRDSADLDYLHLGSPLLVSGRTDINSHNAYAGLYPAAIPDLVMDPAYHVAVDGIRILRPRVLRSFKAARDEIKDRHDLTLLDAIDAQAELGPVDSWAARPVLWILGDDRRAEFLATLLGMRGDAMTLTVLRGWDHARSSGFVPSGVAGLSNLAQAALVDQMLLTRPPCRVLLIRDQLSDDAPLLEVADRFGRGRVLAMWWREIDNWREHFVKGIAAFCARPPDAAWERSALEAWAGLGGEELS